MKTVIAIISMLALSACASHQNTSTNWRAATIPLENGEFVTDIKNSDKNAAAELALRAAYATCEDRDAMPVVLDRSITRDGLVSETTSQVYDAAKGAAMVFGGFLAPSIGSAEYTASYTFRCEQSAPL